jgi:hypothetical protein
MCRRDTNDVLVRRFLDQYHVNLLALPGRRVRCGSVYVKDSARLTAPGRLNDIVKPPVTLPEPFAEDRLPSLSGTWSDSVSVNVGIRLLHNFLTALGAGGLIDKLQASVRQAKVRNIAFSFDNVSRESVEPTALGAALAGRYLAQDNAWVAPGNQYFVVGAVLRSNSISIQGRGQRDSAVGLGAGLVTVADIETGVQVNRDSDSKVSYHGRDELAIAVELYELRWDEGQGSLMFHTPGGPVPIVGLKEDEPPDPVFVGAEQSAFIAAEEPGPRS